MARVKIRRLKIRGWATGELDDFEEVSKEVWYSSIRKFDHHFQISIKLILQSKFIRSCDIGEATKCMVLPVLRSFHSDATESEVVRSNKIWVYIATSLFLFILIQGCQFWPFLNQPTNIWPLGLTTHNCPKQIWFVRFCF